MTRPPRGTVPRCKRCYVHIELCVCASLHLRATAVRVVMLMQYQELKKPTNTGRLVPLLLEGAEMRVRGDPAGPFRVDDLVVPERRVLLLDPAGEPLARDPADPRPVTLLVPDGTWRQARRTARRGSIALRGVPRVRLPEAPPAPHRLRDAPSPDRVSTLEAVARAVGVLDGPEVQAHLEAAFRLVVTRTLSTRGQRV